MDLVRSVCFSDSTIIVDLYQNARVVLCVSVSRYRSSQKELTFTTLFHFNLQCQTPSTLLSLFFIVELLVNWTCDDSLITLT